jgi:menaquinone-specific isochorismate synthase
VTIAARSDPAGAPLVARTTEVADPGPLLALLPEADPLAWVRHGDGLVGWGVAASCRPTGPDRFAIAQQWWDDVVARSVIRDELGLPGSGLVAFGSFAFADDPGESLLVVPRVVVGRRHEGGRVRTWVTVVGAGQLPSAEDPTPALPPAAPQSLRYADGALSGAQWVAAVEDAVRRIGAGELEKVVLGRATCWRRRTTHRSPDGRWAAQRDLPGCWTYCVDGLVGATPSCWCAASAVW